MLHIANQPTIPLEIGPFAPGTWIDQRFLLDKQLGTGGISHVYRAYDCRQGKLVIIKLLAPAPRSDGLSFTARRNLFARESVALKSLHHVSAPQLYMAQLRRWPLYLAMEYIEGVTLDVWLASGTRSLAERLALFDQIAAQVAALHAQTPPLLHLDLKLANILVDRRGRAWLIDFNCAGVVVNGLCESPRLGTLPYAPPEQWVGKPLTVAADIHALGYVLRFMLTDCQYPQALDQVIAHATRLAANRRYQRVAALRTALRMRTSKRRRWQWGPRYFGEASGQALLTMALVIILAILVLLVIRYTSDGNTAALM